MFKQLKYINQVECRPASYKDFEDLEVEGKPCSIKYGTLRNKISALRKKGAIERYYNSKASFFVIKGVRFGKHKNRDLEINKLSNTINSLPNDSRGLHDIHLKFIVPDIWKILSYSGKFKIIRESKDILLPPL